MAEISESAPALEVRSLVKTYGVVPALRGLDLTVMPGESVAVFGPNGAGKTTLLKILASIISPTAGRVTINGSDIKTHAMEALRQIGIVSHHTYLYGNLTAVENLKFYARMYDITETARIFNVISQVGMTPRQNDQVATLSRGMQQRLSIARAILHQPAIMLLDEPDTGLDQQAMSALWKLIQSNGLSPRTVIFSTHSLERGLELASRLIIINRGKMVFQTSANQTDITELKENYRSLTGTNL
jgi:heme ABC exporter ATP-binding subunit CcmA